MVRRAMQMVGAAFVLLGLTVLTYPTFSVMRVANQSLTVLPALPGVDVIDDGRGLTALFDSNEFLLATRTYLDVEQLLVEEALLTAGFEIWRGETPSENGFSISCCGEYDAIVVHLVALEGHTILTTTAADSDVTAIWPIALFMGVACIFVGLLLWKSSTYSAVAELAELTEEASTASV